MATNLQIKFIKSLQLKKNRYEHKRYVCEGDKIVQELIQHNKHCIEIIYATEEWVSRQTEVYSTIELVSPKDLERMSGLSTAPSVLALVRFAPVDSIKSLQTVSLYLDQISDPGNLGTIIRTCDWYGLNQVFLSPNCVDIYSTKVIQSSMGSIFRVNCIEIDFKNLISQYHFSQIYATAMKGKNINDINNTQNILIVMGSESHGVSTEIFNLCTEKITIPSYGYAESLNVSVASGIILHQIISRNNKFA